MKHLIENIFLLVLIIIGGAGMAFSFVSNSKTATETFTTSVATTEFLNSNNNLFEELNSYLNISGTQEAGETLQFEVKSFNSNAHYYLDFGNGQKKAFKNKKQKFVYQLPGNFKLKLFITYQGKTKLAHSEIINIDSQVVASSETTVPN